MNDDARNNLLSDIYLLAFLALMGLTALLMSFTGNVILNTIYMALTILSIIITYFYGIYAGFVENLVFIFLQVIAMFYIHGVNPEHLPISLVFWLIMPMLLSGCVYQMTTKQREIQSSNNNLRKAIAEQGAFDTETNLRTTIAYVQDANVFIETNRRFNLPVSTIIIRIRYYEELKRMMSVEQQRFLLEITSNVITRSTRENDVTYYLNNELPTWGILVYTDSDGAKIAAERIKENFQKNLATNEQLNGLNISLAIGISMWNADEMNSPYDLIDGGVKEIEYDVPAS
ncbi:GGDEF domain-containing protein [Lentilactobacillus sp. SPB1-3]|uniref:GGDEF domain-containing protein n=1 Tax=Lentilactobacillus terminaliae TaxID=3003483 RepID=A0ACD5DFS1_9LACO|nr:GGDEF domain-containing protein [Lentilactobacillus sp. SPB1-3]MCZ0976589.1 GGDEF domain-containing protein [Lentilactobacillus sp. SPB1-3]